MSHGERFADVGQQKNLHKAFRFGVMMCNNQIISKTVANKAIAKTCFTFAVGSSTCLFIVNYKAYLK
jgi:hypothetical protein